MKYSINLAGCLGAILVFAMTSDQMIAQNEMKSIVGGEDCTVVGLLDYPCRDKFNPNYVCHSYIPYGDPGVTGQFRDKLTIPDINNKCPVSNCAPKTGQKIKPDLESCDRVPAMPND